MFTNSLRMVAVVLLLSAANAVADTVTLGVSANARILSVNPDGTNDTWALSVYTWSPEGNYQRSALLFDVSVIPSSAVVNSATLTLHSNPGSPTGNNDKATSVWRITTPWTQGGVSWNNATVDTAWATAGGDFTGYAETANPYVSSSLSVAGGANVALTWDVTALVREWVFGTYANNGLMLTGDDFNQMEMCAWNSTNSYYTPTSADLPSLSITYAVPEPSTVILMCGMGIGLLAYAWRRRS